MVLSIPLGFLTQLWVNHWASLQVGLPSCKLEVNHPFWSPQRTKWLPGLVSQASYRDSLGWGAEHAERGLGFFQRSLMVLTKQEFLSFFFFFHRVFPCQNAKILVLDCRTARLFVKLKIMQMLTLLKVRSVLKIMPNILIHCIQQNLNDYSKVFSNEI